MTKVAKYVYSIAIIAGLLLGTGGGYYMMFTASRDWRETMRTIAPEQLSDYAYAQYLRADGEHGKRALEELAALLEDAQRLRPRNLDNWSRAYGNCAADLGVTYTRLAILAEDAHDQGASDAYVAKAVVWYSVSGRKQRPADELKATVKELDAKLRVSKTLASGRSGG
jgi:hypothetical protein